VEHACAFCGEKNKLVVDSGGGDGAALAGGR
jgi:hypothetical protein